MKKPAIAACICLLFMSCGAKEHSNPLDPSNNSTHGSPPGFVAVALDGRVTFRWDPLELDGLIGFNLYRREAGMRAFQLLPGAPLPAGAGATADSSVTNGVTYEYTLVPLIEGYGEGVPSPLRVATPGPDFVVASDACEGILTRLSADMRASVWTAGGFYYPVSVAAAGGRVWLADLYTGVYCLTVDGALLWQSSGQSFPRRLAVSAGGLCGVVDAVASEVTILSPEGGVRATISNGLERPFSVAFDAEANLWLSDPPRAFVGKYSPEGALLASFAGCSQPSYLAADGFDNSVWVFDASGGELVKLDSAGIEVFRVPLPGTVSCLTADSQAGGCWVADEEADVVTRVASNGKVLFRVGKLGGPVSLFASRNGKTWVLGAKEPRITVLSAGGQLQSALAFGQCPTALVVLGR